MKSVLSAVALAAATFLATAPASAAISVSFDPNKSHVAIGGNVDVNMRISGLSDEILSAFDINLLFNESIVDNTQLTFFTSQFGFPDDYVDVTFSNGNTGVIAGSLLSDDELNAIQDNDFVMLSFRFIGMSDGKTTLQLGPDADFERNFVGRDALSLDVSVGTACIAVGNASCEQQNPEPASFALAGLALFAAGYAARRRRAGDQG